MLEAAPLTNIGTIEAVNPLLPPGYFVGNVGYYNTVFGSFKPSSLKSPFSFLVKRNPLPPGCTSITPQAYGLVFGSFCAWIVQAVQPFRQWTLNDWIPARDPGPNDNFCGINRSLDFNRCSGIRYNGSHAPVSRISSEIYNALQLVLIDGGNPDYCLLSTKAYKADVLGIIALNGSYTFFNMKVFEDPTLAENEAFLIQSDSWEHHEDPTTGNGNLVCSHPGYNARIKLPQIP